MRAPVTARAAAAAALLAALALGAGLARPAAAGDDPAQTSALPPAWPFSSLVGVNYSRAYGQNPLPVATAMKQIAQYVSIVKLYGNDPNIVEALQAAHASGLQIALGTTNDQIAAFQSPSAATSYVSSVVAGQPYSSSIKTLIVGNEPFLNNVTSGLVTALTNVRQALQAAGLNIPVTTTVSIGTLGNSYPPGCAVFASNYLTDMTALLTYLGSIGSFILLDTYPYQALKENQADIPLAYALGTQPQDISTQCGSRSPEPSLFQAQLDAFNAAIKTAGIAPPPAVFIGEIGWASADSAVASTANEATFINTFAQYAVGNSIPSFLFEMYDEPKKCNACDENFYGLFQESGAAKPGFTFAPIQPVGASGPAGVVGFLGRRTAALDAQQSTTLAPVGYTDEDGFAFHGHRLERVTITLRPARAPLLHEGTDAVLLLEGARGEALGVARGALPLAISVKLPRTGTYSISILDQVTTGGPVFQGYYELVLETSDRLGTTATPGPSIE